MVKRLLSSAVGIAFAVIIFTLNLTKTPIILNIAVAIIACMSLHEILVATKLTENPSIVAISFAVTAFIQFIPLFPELWWMKLMAICAVAYFVVVFLTLLIRQKTVSVERTSLGMMVTALIAFPFYSINYLYWKSPYDTGEFHNIGQALVIFCFLVSWFTDAGAYFSGRLLGKHKLAPTISPNKTVEGAVGGLILGVGFTALVAYILTGPLALVDFEVNWVNLIITTAICSPISMIGDLSFSLIKRNYNIKDFGKIMPGHGGILDRFDSVIFVSPVVCVMNIYLPIIVK